MEINNPEDLLKAASKFTHMELDGFLKVIWWLDEDLARRCCAYWFNDYSVTVLEQDMNKKANKSLL